MRRVVREADVGRQQLNTYCRRCRSMDAPLGKRRHGRDVCLRCLSDELLEREEFMCPDCGEPMEECDFVLYTPELAIELLRVACKSCVRKRKRRQTRLRKIRELSAREALRLNALLNDYAIVLANGRLCFYHVTRR